jgi:hypothetical protein
MKILPSMAIGFGLIQILKQDKKGKSWKKTGFIAVLKHQSLEKNMKK